MHHTTTTPIRRGRARRALVALFALSLVAASCGDDGGTDQADADDGGESAISSTTLAPDVEEATPGGTLIVGLEADANTLLPGAGTSNTNVARAIFDGIAIRGSDGEIHPYMAASIEPNETADEWTVTLREGIEFSDGTPLDAQAVKDNFDNYIDIEGTSMGGTIAPIDELRVDGPLTYTYVLNQANAAFADLLTGELGRPFSNAACDAAGPDCGNTMVGAGPFVLVNWQRDSEFRLARNENYWRQDADGNQLPYLDELIFRPIPDEDARLASVLSGDIHVGQTLRQSLVRNAEEAEAEGRIQSLESIGNNGGGSIFNTIRPPVDDIRVRQALVRATNQQELIAVLGGEGLTPPQTQFFSPNSPWFSAAVEDAYPTYDPDGATELLDQYINDPERSDGRAVGQPIEVDYQCPPDPSLLAISQAYQGYWNAIGIDVNLVQVEQPVLITNAIGTADQEPPFSGSFMITCFRMGGEADPYTTLYPSFGPPETSPGNIANYVSEDVDGYLETLRTATDFETRYAAVESMMMELTETLPLMWTGGTATALYAQNDVRNLGGWTTPDGALGDGVVSALTYWGDVWIAR